jgi:tetratricopeptide (TPR) repeat protein
MECLLKAYMFDEANTYSAQLMKKEDLCNNPRILCWRGKALIYSGADVLGKKHLQQALNYDPDLKECQTILKLQIKSNKMKDEAAAVFKDGKYEEAIQKFEECLELDPINGNFNSTLLLNIAICEVKLNHNDKALVALNKAIKMNKKYAKALVKRGEVYMAMGEYTDAIRDFSEASEYDSNGFGV